MPALYKLIRAPLFRLPAEQAHESTSALLGRALASARMRRLVARRLLVTDPALRVERWGIKFPNPVGLAAGFDKSGGLFNALGALGFGHVEIGTVTAEPQPGNEPPRLFRLPADAALLNRMGFNSPGAEEVAASITTSPIETVLGVNIGKSKATPLERAADDYLRSLELLHPFAAYVAVNVSSPNTPGLRSLQDAGPLRSLLGGVVRRARELAGDRPPRPVLVKLAPDLTDSQIEEAVAIAAAEGVSGIVAVNTTVSRAGLRTSGAEVERLGLGGISGAPLRARAQEVVGLIYRQVGDALPIIGVGGISSAEDAWERIRAGASLLQLYTAFVYEGPLLPRRINLGLLERMDREGVRTIDEIRGSSHR